MSYFNKQTRHFLNIRVILHELMAHFQSINRIPYRDILQKNPVK